MQLLQSSLKC